MQQKIANQNDIFAFRKPKLPVSDLVFKKGVGCYKCVLKIAKLFSFKNHNDDNCNNNDCCYSDTSRRTCVLLVSIGVVDVGVGEGEADSDCDGLGVRDGLGEGLGDFVGVAVGVG